MLHSMNLSPGALGVKAIFVSLLAEPKVTASLATVSTAAPAAAASTFAPVQADLLV